MSLQRTAKQNNSKSAMPLNWQKAIKEAKDSVKHLDKKIQRNVSKGLQYDCLNNTSFNNIVYPKDKIPDRLLRLVEKRNGIVAAVVTLRIQQALEFCHVSDDKDIPGWAITLKDSKKTSSVLVYEFQNPCQQNCGHK